MTKILAALIVFSAMPAFAEEMELTPDMVRDVTRLIQTNGFNCPRVKMADTRGPDALGDVVRVWCGPDDGTDNVYGDFQYRVTALAAGGFDVAEW